MRERLDKTGLRNWPYYWSKINSKTIQNQIGIPEVNKTSLRNWPYYWSKINSKTIQNQTGIPENYIRTSASPCTQERFPSGGFRRLRAKIVIIFF
jgi:hypothetical protein